MPCSLLGSHNPSFPIMAGLVLKVGELSFQLKIDVLATQAVAGSPSPGGLLLITSSPLIAGSRLLLISIGW